MSNEQYPSPWSRDAANQAAGQGGNTADPGNPAPPANDEQTTRIDPSAAQSDAQQPAGTPFDSAQQPVGTPFDSAQQAAWAPPTSGWQPTSQQAGAYFAPASGTSTTAKGRSRLAGVLAVAVLAAGIGGGAGFAAAQFSSGAWGSAASATGSTSSATETQVVQADPSNPNWTAVADSATKAVVAITVTGQSGSALGSGVVIDAQGHIVTNNHVVSSLGTNAQITVTLGNATYAATVIGTDPTTDLAVIQLVDPPSNLSVMAFADESKLQVGDPVMAIGNPLGLDDTVTTGIVSALNRPVTTQAVTDNSTTNPAVAQSRSDNLVVTAAIQTNAAINPGNSGGALVNTEGQLVGITSSIASLTNSSSSSEAGNIGLGFAIGSTQVQYVAEQLISQGYAEHPQIGISASDPNSTTGLLGAVVAQVVSGSPAEAAGLQVGDLITQVDGAQVTSTESLVALVRNGQVGKEMTLTVDRNNQEIQITVTPVAAAS